MGIERAPVDPQQRVNGQRLTSVAKMHSARFDDASWYGLRQTAYQESVS